jgi:hypothetical protein
MSECRICKNNGYPGVSIAWKNENGRFLPLELDKSTPHKHFQANGNGNGKSTPIPTVVANPKVDLNNLNVIKVLAAALSEYIALKEGK